MPSQENKPSARELDSASPLKTHLVSSDSNIVALVEKYLEKIKNLLTLPASPSPRFEASYWFLSAILSGLIAKTTNGSIKGEGSLRLAIRGISIL